jgi:uncharacterized membrane protein
MSRINIIDSIRGFSFFPMFIFHIFAAYDLVNLFTTSTVNNPSIHFLGLIRNVFIILAGVSMSLSVINKKDNVKYYTSRLKRSLKILVHAMFLTALTHYLFPGFGIKFGVLHFIGLSTLLLSPIAGNNFLLVLLAIVLLFVKIPSINPTIDTITGAGIHYNMADWFPLQKYLPLMIFGILLGKLIFNDMEKKDDKSLPTVLEYIGRESLNFYTGHLTLLILVFYIWKKYFTNRPSF